MVIERPLSFQLPFFIDQLSSDLVTNPLKLSYFYACPITLDIDWTFSPEATLGTLAQVFGTMKSLWLQVRVKLMWRWEGDVCYMLVREGNLCKRFGCQKAIWKFKICFLTWLKYVRKVFQTVRWTFHRKVSLHLSCSRANFSVFTQMQKSTPPFRYFASHPLRWVTNVRIAFLYDSTFLIYLL